MEYKRVRGAAVPVYGIMRRKTVCFFCGDITRCGGTERASTMVANLLHRQGSYKVVFLSLTEQGSEPFFPLDEGIARCRLGDSWISPGPGYLKVLPKLRRFLKDQDVDVIVDIDIVLDSLSVPASAGLKARVVSWEHFNYQFELSVPYRRLILKHLTRRTDYVVTLTERDRGEYVRRFGPQGRIRAIGNPIGEVASMPGIRKENWIVTVGRLTPEKGPEHLLEAARHVLGKHPDWRWIVLGEGEMRPFLEDGIRRRRLEGRLILEGSVKDVGAYLRKSRIYAMTSRYEGLGICLLEAKAHGLPCVAFDVPAGPAELIADGVNGYLIPAFDCGVMAERIGRLIEEEALRERFSSNAGLGMEKYGPDFVLEQWNRVIGQACSPGRRRSA